MLGVMPTQQAMDLANEKKLDLVNISPNAKPPVCKILDYGKYRYELQKKEKEARKKQKTTQVKEIRLSTFIEEHDIQVKANTAAKFLKDGDKVKVSLRFRGRERDYAAKGMDVMKTFAESVSEVGVIEKKPLFEGRSLTMDDVPLHYVLGRYDLDLHETHYGVPCVQPLMGEHPELAERYLREAEARWNTLCGQPAVSSEVPKNTMQAMGGMS